MVLQPVNRRRIGRLASDAENRRPSFSVPGTGSRARKHASHKLSGKSSGAKAATRVPGSHRVLLDSRRRISAAVSKKRFVASMPDIEQEVPDVEMMEVVVPAASSSSARNCIRFPRHLAHPKTRYPSNDALAAVNIDAKANLQYTRFILRGVGPQMLQVLNGLSFDIPSKAIPKTLELTVNDLSGEMPTHAFAVWPLADKLKRNSIVPTPVRIHPFHGCIVAANTAHLPTLPRASPALPCSKGSKITVPVVPLAVPHLDSFKFLLSYLYTKDMSALFELIFPCPVPYPFEGKNPLDLVQEYGTKIARCSPQDVINSIITVHGVWQNACYLGVFDDGLWATLDLSWEILLTALSKMHGPLAPATRP